MQTWTFVNGNTNVQQIIALRVYVHEKQCGWQGKLCGLQESGRF
jgi:hypothetical protein